MAQIMIPTEITEIYEVSVMTGRYDNDGNGCDYYTHKDYPKYFTDYSEAEEYYNSIKIDNSEYPQQKELTTISLIDSVPDKNDYAI